MPKKRHVPPSRQRYEENHPTVSARVPLQLHARIKLLQMQSGKSLATIIEEAVEKQEPVIKGVWVRGYEQGEAAAIKRYRIIYRCNRCGGTIHAESDDVKKAAARLLREAGWGHTRCHKG